MSTPEHFYDSLAEHYHLVFPDWRASSQAQGRALHALLEAETGPGSRRILDCACGIGTQALSLAALGHELTGTDISARAVERGRVEARILGLERLRFEVIDFFSLPDWFEADFDVVIACDNALPHLVTEAEVRRAAASFRSCMRPGGLLLISTRDYDRILPDRPSGTLPGRFAGDGPSRIVFQVWDWLDDSSYSVELFLLLAGSDGWDVISAQTTYRAWQRHELTELIEASGFGEAAWHDPETTGNFQPVLTARSV